MGNELMFVVGLNSVALCLIKQLPVKRYGRCLMNLLGQFCLFSILFPRMAAFIWRFLLLVLSLYDVKQLQEQMMTFLLLIKVDFKEVGFLLGMEDLHR